MIFDELEEKKLTFVNLVLLNMTFPQNFIVDKRPTNFQPALHSVNLCHNEFARQVARKRFKCNSAFIELSVETKLFL